MIEVSRLKDLNAAEQFLGFRIGAVGCQRDQEPGSLADGRPLSLKISCPVWLQSRVQTGRVALPFSHISKVS
jgi:hypothetical protein